MPSKKQSGNALYQKGDRLTLAIDDLADAGEGVGHAEGFAFFVKDAVPGDIVEATVMKMKRSYGYAHLDRIVRPSPDRVSPPCPAARACGGCQLEAYDYPAELAWKDRRVRQTLARIGGIAEDVLTTALLPIVGADNPYRYRNKAQFPVAPGRDGTPVAGFYAARTHNVVLVEDCLLGDSAFSEIRRLVLSHSREHGISAHEERTGQGILRHILIRRGHHSGQIGVTLVLNREERPGRTLSLADRAERLFPGAAALADVLFREVPGMVSLSLNLNTGRSNVILGHTLIPVRGDLCIEDSMCGLRFRISPLSFYQVNTAQAEKLYQQALDFAGLSGTETAIDLYCGIGTITLLAAQHAARVIGIEAVPEAIADAERNAARNGIHNAEFRVGRAEDALPALLAEGVCADLLIVDPPRAGLDASCVDVIRRLAPSRIVYISCNPATLARDLKLFATDVDGMPPYRLKAARPFDLFPKTVHIEVATLLEQPKTEA